MGISCQLVAGESRQWFRLAWHGAVRETCRKGMRGAWLALSGAAYADAVVRCRAVIGNSIGSSLR
jgi:hypothetical protein